MDSMPCLAMPNMPFYAKICGMPYKKKDSMPFLKINEMTYSCQNPCHAMPKKKSIPSHAMPKKMHAML